MRDSRVLKKLRAGQVVLCTQIGSAHAPFAAIAAQSGFDCVWLDMEHKAVREADVRECILSTNLYDCDTVVRIRKRGYLDYFRPLEDGATGVMVPHCKSGAEAREAVRNTKFQPLGLRGMDFTGLASDYMMTDIESCVAHGNQQTFTMLQIEDVEALEAIEDICAVAGVDLLFIGPADLKQSAMAHGVYHDGFIAAAREKVNRAVAGRENLYWGTVAGSAEDAAGLYREGCRFINIRGDYGVLALGFQALCQDVAAALEGKA